MVGKNLVRAVVAAVIALAGVTIPLAGTAFADPAVKIVNRAFDQCLDADTGTLDANGTKVQLWDCHDGDNQWWHYDRDTGTLRNDESGRCLDVDLADHRIQLWDCHGGDNQRWRDDPTGLALESDALDSCLDVAHDSLRQNGAEIQVQECTDAPSQQWSFIYD
ncbi:RICIN domain-containing protein [Kibdelosporangium persicum]|uniref:Ricin B-type lectin domain-containing protein n=1 Tax=Kibdelosporangium persicum TaxID=2698649 RepID=A0ABX2FBS4_9PSEU|nr:RICIN domain-containing protein [Kibdelosporangium persicum]NRN68752.1 Ricin B-type lectin domain-containing protein [Kibdelosporangium persicum]